MGVERSKTQSINEMLIRNGINVVYYDIYKMQEVWINWYRGNVNNFHTFKQKNARGIEQTMQRNSMNMAKKVCEDWSSLIVNEDIEVVINNTEANEVYNNVIRKNNDKEKLSDLVEKAFAIGEGYMIEYNNNNITSIDYITGNYIFVTGYINNQITSLVSFSEFKKKEIFYTHLTYHILEREGDKSIYKIVHQVWQSDTNTELGEIAPITIVFSEEEVNSMRNIITNDKGEEEVWYGFEYETSIVHFQQIKPNISNNYEMQGIRGISIFANSIDTLKSIDIVDDAMSDEVELAAIRIFVDQEYTKKQNVTNSSMNDHQAASIQEITYYDSSQKVFITIPGLSKNDHDPIRFFAPQMRMDQIQMAKNQFLSELSFKCGLGRTYYKFDAQSANTATEVISNNSDTWKNKVKHEIVIGNALINRARAILFLEQENGNLSPNVDIENVEIKIKFDDSIINDDEKLREQDLQIVQLQMMPEYIFLMKWNNLTEKEAKNWIEESTEDDFNDEEETEEVEEIDNDEEEDENKGDEDDKDNNN